MIKTNKQNKQNHKKQPPIKKSISWKQGTNNKVYPNSSYVLSVKILTESRMFER